MLTIIRESLVGAYADYAEDLNSDTFKNLDNNEYVLALRRESKGFARGTSKYRGVTLHR